MERSPPPKTIASVKSNSFNLKSKNMKTTFLKISFIFLFLSLIGSGCEKQDVSQLDQIDFKIVAMDKNKTETSAFEVGEDVALSFKAINNSGKALELKLKSDYLACKVYQNEKDFLFVNKKSDNYNFDSSFVPVGKPLLNPINCETINLPYYAQNFPKGETILESTFWSSNPDNKKLEPGKYFTVFTFTLLDIEGHSKTWNLRTDFEIK
ncbi:MAG: hypothetical protein Q8S54_01040 [Bacteroidota bacterium]|nr:hypothetical protein [Bacteroidota bacterium]